MGNYVVIMGDKKLLIPAEELEKVEQDNFKVLKQFYREEVDVFKKGSDSREKAWKKFLKIHTKRMKLKNKIDDILVR